VVLQRPIVEFVTGLRLEQEAKDDTEGIRKPALHLASLIDTHMMAMYALHGRVEVRSKRKRLDDGYGQNYERQTGAKSHDERSGRPSGSGRGYASGYCERFANCEQIQRRAYELFLARGGVHGNDWIDWFTAERELIGSHLRTE
jgi:hypothetical protein